MTEDQFDLARRAVACKNWRWMPGMLTTYGLRAEHNGDGMVAIWHDRKRNEWGEESLTGRLPDLTDPATLGCLLALVREAWGGHDVWIEPRFALSWRRVVSWNVVAAIAEEGLMTLSAGPTQAAALVAALEAAP